MIEYIKLNHIKNGDKIAKPLHLANGKMLLAKGSNLTPQIIARLKDLGYRGLYIENESDIRRELIPPQKPWISDELQMLVIATLSKLFQRPAFLSDPYDTDFTVNMRNLEEHIKEIILILQRLHDEDSLIYEFDDIRNDNEWILYHSLNSCLLSTAVAIELGIKDRELFEFSLGTILHDLAKAGSPIANNKNITEDEKKELRKHSETMFRVLQKRGYKVPTTYAIWQHHEYIDGSGYPNALQGNSITIYGKILALANTFDNLTHYTPYKDSIVSAKDAIEMLYADQRFDTSITRILAGIVAVYPVGSKVLLSTGEEALVIKNSKYMPQRPMIVVNMHMRDMSEEILSTTIKDTIDDSIYDTG